MHRNNPTIFDVMVVIVGMAIGLCAWKGFASTPIMSASHDSIQWYYFQALGATALLAPMSLTLLVLSLRQPRPRMHRLVQEPAVIVGLATLFILIINTALLFAVVALLGSNTAIFGQGKVLYFCKMLTEQVGMSIAVAWLIRAVGGRRRSRKTWLDIPGWALGACWISLAIVSAVYTLL